MTTITRSRRTTTTTKVVRVATLTAATAVAANLSVFGLASAGGISFELAQRGSTETVTAGSVLGATLFTMALGWVLVALTEWRQRPTLRTVAIIGATFAVVTALPVLSFDAETSTKLALASLHLVAGAFFIAGIASLTRDHNGEAG